MQFRKKNFSSFSDEIRQRYFRQLYALIIEINIFCAFMVLFCGLL